MFTHFGIRRIVQRLLDVTLIYDVFQRLVTRKKLNVLKTKTLSTLRTPVLDFGCGSGVLAPFFSSNEYLGFDPIKSCISKARSKFPNYDFRVGGHELLNSFPNKTFGSCVSWGVLHHLNDMDLKQSLEGINQVLETDGYFVALEPVYVSTPNFNLRNFMMKFDRGAYVRTEMEYIEKLSEAGFVNAEIEIFEDLVRLPYRQALIVAQKV